MPNSLELGLYIYCMKILFIITRSYLQSLLHQKVASSLASLNQNPKVDKCSVFFTSKAALIAATGQSAKDKVSDLNLLQFKKVQAAYQSLDSKIELLVCGRAFKDFNLDDSNLDSSFVMSGNMELSMLIAGYDKVVEF